MYKVISLCPVEAYPFDEVLQFINHLIFARRNKLSSFLFSPEGGAFQNGQAAHADLSRTNLVENVEGIRNMSAAPSPIPPMGLSSIT